MRKANMAFVGALTILPHLAVAAGITIPSLDIMAPDDTMSLPTANIESECRDAQAAIDPELRSSAYEACVRDERAAFQQLRQRWPHYSAEARVTCVWPDSEVSYVALQTCLEMQPGGNLAVRGAGSDGLNSYDYDIMQSSRRMASPPSTMASPSPAMGPMAPPAP